MTIGRHFKAQNRNGGGEGARKNRQSFSSPFKNKREFAKTAISSPHSSAALHVFLEKSHMTGAHVGEFRIRQFQQKTVRPLLLSLCWTASILACMAVAHATTYDPPPPASPSLLVAAVIMQANILVLSLSARWSRSRSGAFLIDTEREGGKNPPSVFIRRPLVRRRRKREGDPIL